MAVFKLRQDVFMLEQQSLYADIDGLDEQSQHLLLWRDNNLLAYGRLRVLGSDCIVKFERIIVGSQLRGQGVGNELMSHLIDKAKDDHPHYDLKLSAQSYAISFYEKWGFHCEGDVYDDGGIPHIDMRKE
jgi:ElaA protein